MFPAKHFSSYCKVGLPVCVSSFGRQSRATVNPSKRICSDGLPSYIAKDYFQIFVTLLDFIFNITLKSRIFFSLWKSSVILVYKKKGSSFVVSNYRPVSFLNIFSIFFEIAIHNYPPLFFFSNKISASQHGFRNVVPPGPVWLLILTFFCSL